MIALAGGLTDREREDLRRYESVLEVSTFREAGEALKAIRDGRLYRETHRSFDRYCRERWGMTRRSADRLVLAFDITDGLRPIGLIPTHENQVRPLIPLAPEQRREVWSRALDLSGDTRPTAALIQSIVAEVVGFSDKTDRDGSSPVWSLAEVLSAIEAVVLPAVDDHPEHRGPIADKLRSLAQAIEPVPVIVPCDPPPDDGAPPVVPDLPSLTYGSVCSGIEAATVAWHPLGWRPAWFAEVAEFPNAVLDHHYPQVPNHGDFTAIECEPGSVDLLVGGTPCQDFSITGLRRGLDEDRGQLAVEYLRLAGRLQPRWVLWENVPGVLSIDGGRAFDAFLGGMAECGYGWAYRVLDAYGLRDTFRPQHIIQRRRRVFALGHLGDWRPAVAALFDREFLPQSPHTPCPLWEAVPARNGDDLPPSHRGRGDVFGWTGDETPKFGVNRFPTMRASQGGEGYCVAIPPDIVRKLSPLEAERLMGFEDDYTRVPSPRRGSGHWPDKARLIALGNSIAVPVLAWIGERIGRVHALLATSALQRG